MANERATQQDVARRAGVSQRLVSAVLHHNAIHIRVSAETRRRVERAAAELGYRPNVVARSLVTGKTRTIGFVVSTLANPFLGELTDSIHRAAAVHSYDLMIALEGRGSEHESHPIEQLLDRQVEGLLLWRGPVPGISEVLARSGNGGPPCVVVGVEVPDAVTSYVSVDRRAGVAAAVTHLVRLGHSRLGYVGCDASPERRQAGTTKFHGFLQGLAAHGLSPDRVWSYAPSLWGVDHLPLCLSLAEEIAQVPDLPLALVLDNDRLALALLAVFARTGVRVPEDVALIGYDDVPGAATSVPSLTTLAQPTRELAETAVRFLLERIEEGDGAPRRSIIVPQLIVRESCGAGQTHTPLLLGSRQLREETSVLPRCP